MSNDNFVLNFLSSKKPHILNITNHGIHDWEIRSGLKDTGGQNHYVNAMTDALVNLGYRVTICNRGGFPDPENKKLRSGIIYKNDNARIVYLEGGPNEFVRKEDLDDKIIKEEAEFAKKLFASENANFDLIISHYWDGALVAHYIKENLGLKAKHLWIPHSLGALKRENFEGKPEDVIKALRFDERITYEKMVIANADSIGSTSNDIQRVLKHYYNRTADLFFPPCIDTKIFHPVKIEDCKDIYRFLEEQDPISGGDVEGKKCLLEISRTDRTKRKDLLIKAFAELNKSNPETRLLLTASPDGGEVYNELVNLANNLGVRKKIVFIGMVKRKIISELYALSSIYCSPSEMEGFGMSVQEACACERPVVTSNLVPFAMEYLLEDEKIEKINGSDGKKVDVRWGKSGVVSEAGSVEGFSHALKRLAEDDMLRKKIAENAFKTTIPYFTWSNMTERMLEDLGIKLPNS